MHRETTVLLDGLAFPEGPRWRDGKLWFSDMHARAVMTVDATGSAETVVDVPGQPSGLGWLPDGRLLIVSMTDRRLLRLDPDGLAEVANLEALASFHCNDMVVDGGGCAYVGNFGFDLDARETPKPAEIVRVTPEGDARIVADDLDFPNGSVITPDGRTLIVGESFGACLTAFDIEADGSLGGRRVWARLERAVPDGICLDAEGAIWVASPVSAEVLRVHEGGAVSDRVKVSTQAFACMLGGDDRRTLFVCTATTSRGDEARAQRAGRIETARVESPGAGLP
ncbi:MAG: SMP-30/gluconolactonase/LRE family protein [Deltaproteobacteria bacterium]|nr:MAG: SMP-30/gluconolactonase/LRE family protein [Deltaproteobacteria bacterium]